MSIKLLFQAQIQILVEDLFLATILLSSSGLVNNTHRVAIFRFPSSVFFFTFRGQTVRPMLKLTPTLSTDFMATEDLLVIIRVTPASMGVLV